MPKNSRPKKKPITDEIATVEKDITQYYLGKVLTSEGRGEGLKLYEDLERDDRVFSEMQKRKLGVVGKEWSIEPASDDAQDVKISEFVEQNFKEIKFDRACEELLDGILKGFKSAEIMWDYSEGDIWIKEYRGRDPRRFTFDKQNQLRLLTWANMIEGEEIPDRKFQLLTGRSGLKRTASNSGQSFLKNSASPLPGENIHPAQISRCRINSLTR
jgi:phage gp29-like protein